MKTLHKEPFLTFYYFQKAILKRIDNKKENARFIDHWIDYEEFYNDYNDASGYYDEDSN